MTSNTTICAKNISTDSLTVSNNILTPNGFITRIAKATFKNTTSSDSFLKHAAFFTIKWPANYTLYTTQFLITEGPIVMDTTNDTSLSNIADDQGNAIVGSATSITLGNPPGASGQIIFHNFGQTHSNTDRIKGEQYTRYNYFDLNNSVMTMSMDRTLTGVVYHDANGVNDGGGDGSGTSTGLSDVILYIIVRGFRVTEPDV